MGKINLLIVDDEEEFLDLIKKRLERRNFKVMAVNCGEAAVKAARKKRIDIALVDLKMPGMGGEETLKALKKEHEWMEIVILTGHGSIDSAVQTAKDGAYQYLQKPCEIDVLVETLTKAYKKRVMNRKNIEAHKLEEFLKTACNAGPSAILKKLRELDKEES